ncbi:uncharacterized protein I303_100213 [Kwoniella dejecticola CBS 10117]|uniref:Major facilitator superfamily (MFS) profile domain-containing protein n=1 Tax=Kwoniella dejecticola CBS 10117 TaxID=1296121 RepID=A0A1A6AEE7_9TREE|nr:uncharacterized protein I303_00215 [Kwoniella dejecticola CBS 10117]OBR88398.1 hypothetical protein I303_00215 [Kwoniella dejecticola CBS 10117]
MQGTLLGNESETRPLLSQNNSPAADYSSHPRSNSNRQNGAHAALASVEEEDANKLALSKRPVTPLPKFQLFIACFVRVTEPIAFMACFPFINQMILELGIVDDPRKTGFYAGLIESIFALAELCTVFQWGKASDRWGRKPVLLIGCAGAAVSSILFGFSTTFPMMVLTRTINGLCNGNVAVLKSVISELSDETNQSVAFSFFPLSMAIGTILASSIGGYFPHFATRFPAVGDAIPFIKKYPYCMPSLVAAAFPLISGIVAFFFMKETLPPKKAPKPKPATNGGYRSVNGNQVEEEEHEHDEDDEPAVGFRGLLTADINKLMASFGLLQLQGICFLGLLPLFCFTPIAAGGLSFRESQIGLAMSIRGIATILVQLIAFPFLQKRVGTVRLYKFLVFLFMPAFVILPITNVFALKHQTWAIWTGLAASMALYSVGNMAFACNLIMVNDAAPNRRSLGAINGLSQAVSSLMRAIGPGSASALFALSVNRHLLGGHLIWLVLGCLSVISIVAAMILKSDYRQKSI